MNSRTEEKFVFAAYSGLALAFFALVLWYQAKHFDHELRMKALDQGCVVFR